MCCTIKIGGVLALSCDRISKMTSVPPADEPITIKLLHTLFCGIFFDKLSAFLTNVFFLYRNLVMCDRAAAVIADTSFSFHSSMSRVEPTIGFSITSIAPYLYADNAISLSFLVILDITTTGKGCCFIIFLRNVIPSMRGIWMSRVITSGFSVFILVTATYGSEAVAITSIFSCDEIIAINVCLIRAESSTTSTFILLFEIILFGSF